MTVGLVGNNDGPLWLLRSMQAEGIQSACVGLQKPLSSPLRDRYAAALGDTLFFEGFDEEQLVDTLEPLDLDLLVNVFCNFRFTRLLEQPYDVLNVHLAPLPRYRGRHPLQWALINGETEFGVTVHRMEAAWDAGAILWQRRVPVDPLMSVDALRTRLLEMVGDRFGAFVTRYAAGTVKPRPNDDAKATYVARRFPADSRLTAWHDHQQILRTVMALRSEDYPAYVVVNGQEIAARSAEVVDRFYDGVAAPFVCRAHPSDLTVACLDGHTVRLRDLSPSAANIRMNDRIDPPFRTNR